MKLTRERYVITKNNRTKILCGLDRDMRFCDIDKIGNKKIKTYNSVASAEMGWYGWHCEPIEVLKIKETVEIAL